MVACWSSYIHCAGVVRSSAQSAACEPNKSVFGGNTSAAAHVHLVQCIHIVHKCVSVACLPWPLPLSQCCLCCRRDLKSSDVLLAADG